MGSGILCCYSRECDGRRNKKYIREKYDESKEEDGTVFERQ